MTFFLTIIIVLALCVCGYCAAALFRKYDPKRESAGVPAVVLSLWFVSTAVWSRPFWEVAIPGLFDVTFDRLLLGALLVLLLAGLYTGRVSFKYCVGLELTLLLLVLLCLVSMILHGFVPALPSLPSPWNTFINGYLFPAIVFFFARCYIRRSGDMRFVFTILFFMGTYLSITAFFEFFGLRDFVFPRYISNPEILIHIDRARGPFLNAAFNGAAISFGFICGLHLLAEKKGLARVLHLTLLSLAPPAIFFTQTRSAYLSFLIVLVLFLCFYRTRFPKWKAFALPIALFIAFMIANAPRLVSEDRRVGGVVQTSEIEIRQALFSRSLRIAAIAPFFGVGMGQFLPVSSSSFPNEVASQGFLEELQHFHVLGLLAELGIVGALLYLTLIVLVFRRLYYFRRTLSDNGFINANVMLAMTAVWVVYLTTNLFLEPSYCLFFNAVPFAFAGMVDGMYARSA